MCSGQCTRWCDGNLEAFAVRGSQFAVLLCQPRTANCELLLVGPRRCGAGTDDLYFVAIQIDGDLLAAEGSFRIGHRGRRSVHVNHPTADEIRGLVTGPFSRGWRLVQHDLVLRLDSLEFSIRIEEEG